MISRVVAVLLNRLRYLLHRTSPFPDLATTHAISRAYGWGRYRRVQSDENIFTDADTDWRPTARS
jgi:hypothetical protein